jgi:hypothetical protein
MRALEWGPGEQTVHRPARERGERGDDECLLGVEIGQKPRQAFGQHGLAGTRRAEHHQVMPAGRRHHQRLDRVGVAHDVCQIADGLGRGRRRELPDRFHRVRFEIGPVADQRIPQRHHRHDLDVGHEHRLVFVAARHDEAPEARGTGGDHGREETLHRPHPAIETQLPQMHHGGDRVDRDATLGRQDGDRDGQIVGGALLRQGSRREVDDDLLGRQRAAVIRRRRPDAVFGIGERRIRQPDQLEARDRVRDVCFDLDDRARHSEQCDREGARHHQDTPRRCCMLGSPYSGHRIPTTSIRSS